MLLLTVSFTFFLLVSTATAATHQVHSGDSLYTISLRYQTTVPALKMVNQLHSDLIYPGQLLEIPLIYQVQPGESWYLIGKKFGVSIAQLKQANQTNSDYLISGDWISVPIKSGSNTKTPTPSRGNISYSREEATMLARLINGEARGEPYTGQVAVGAVVLNRVKDGRFPNNINGVIFQKGAFTAVEDGQIWLEITETAKKAASAALGGWDPSGGALYYYNPATATNQWIRNRPIVARIGNHVFAI
ncbi:MAG: cell wall hydrolase [Syntrophomonadaceae bacterium]|jgi:N-acetylmuramoyl-L-alanine amidase|nr:cell wall hydrolase [Syntrophomonadaceae bacterium]